MMKYYKRIKKIEKVIGKGYEKSAICPVGWVGLKVKGIFNACYRMMPGTNSPSLAL